MDRLQQTAQLIRDRIPITRNLAFSLTFWDGRELGLSAPFGPNRNHHDTVFGGSLAMASIVSGYAMTFMSLDDVLGPDWTDRHTLVIRDFKCRYLRPVEGDLHTVSSPEDPAALGVFTGGIKQGEKSRLKVITTISSPDTILLRCRATYVAFSTGPG